MLPSPLLGTAPETVSGVRSPAAARLGGPHGRPEAPGPGAERMDPAGRRGAGDPRRAPPGPRGRRPCAAGSGGPARWGVSLPPSESQGLSQAPAVSSGVSLRPAGGRKGERGFPPFGARGAGAGERGERGERGAARRRREAASPLRGARARSCLQAARAERTASILSPSPALAPSFFPVLQTRGSSSSGNAGRKSAREGRGWKFLAAPRRGE